MAKILYIEDDVDSGIIIKLFRKVISKDIKEKLEDAKSETEIIDIVSESKQLDVCNDFIKIIERVKNIDENYYDLIIMDRDLFGKDNGNYDRSLLPDDFDKDLFFRREGDYLITILNHKIDDLEEKLYFLSGNNDDIRLRSEFKYLLSNKFKENNILEKNSDNYKKLRSIIDNLICVKYHKFDICGEKKELKQYVEILDKYMNQNIAERFIELNNSPELEEIRPVFEELLETLAQKVAVDKLKPDWWLFTRKRRKSSGNRYGDFDFFDDDKFIVKHFIRFLADIKYRYEYSDIENYIERISDNNELQRIKLRSLNNLKKQNEAGDYYFNHNLNISSVIAHNLYSIWEITSAFGAHISDEGYQPTENTVNSLIYQLKEIILWFGNIMSKL